MLTEAINYLETYRYRATQAFHRWEAAAELYRQGMISSEVLAAARQQCVSLHQEWKEAADRLRLDADELLFRLEKSR